MAEEFDRNIFTGLLHAGFAISVGAASKSLEMARNPPETVSKVVAGMKEMFTLPENTGPDFQDKAQALAGVWAEKGISLMSECKAAGEKLTEGK